MLPDKPPAAPEDDDMEEVHLMEYDDVRGPRSGQRRREAYDDEDEEDEHEMRGPGCAHQ